jgi:hypothetical protein
MTRPAVAVLPYGMALRAKLGSLPLTDLDWPLGCPDRLARGTVADLAPTDHLLVFPKTSTHYRLNWGTRAKVSLIMGEPKVVHAKHHALLRLTHHRFHRVLTFNQPLVDRLPNARFLPYGTTWVPDWQDLDLGKRKMCSLIASAKRDTDGHKLRHDIVGHCAGRTEVEVMGRGYQPFDRKSEGLAPYRYSVVIENTREQNYFSEKLIDAILCDTVPIYWGCPNLSDFIAPAGMIICNSADEIKTALNQMSQDDYANRLPALQAARPAALSYCDIERRAAELLLNEA